MVVSELSLSTRSARDDTRFTRRRTGRYSTVGGSSIVNDPFFQSQATAASQRQLLKNVFLAPHTRFFDMETKVRKLSQHPNMNSFNPEGYHSFISELEKTYLERVNNGQ